MSIEVMSLAWYVGDLSPAQKAVLVALADHANEDGRHAYPGVERLTYKTSYAERTVRRALSDLRSMGLIRVVREAKYHRSTEYEIDLSEMQARQNRPARDAPQEESDLPENTEDLPENTEDLPESPNRPARDAPKPSVNRQEPSEEPSAARGEPFEFYENHFGLITPKAERAINRDVDRYGLVWVKDAMRIAIDNDARSWRYVTTILERWEREGRGPRDRQNGQGDVATEAWAVVAAAIKKGRATPIMERQDVLDKLNNIGGWRRVKDASEREITFIKKEFMKEYHV